jgi:hypothetical protein
VVPPLTPVHVVNSDGLVAVLGSEQLDRVLMASICTTW